MIKELYPDPAALFAGREFLHLATVDSTNTFCLENPHILSRPGLVVYADSQQAGRGRMGRRWMCGRGGHLYASFVIHPDLPPVLVPSITICAGLAVYRVFDRLGVPRCSLKWPNDLLVNGLKVCGILLESRPVHNMPAVVAGMGINITGSSSRFPRDIATRLTTLEECGVRTDRDTLLQQIAVSFNRIIIELHSGKSRALFREWEAASGSIGRRIYFTVGQGRGTGMIHGLDDYGRLVVMDAAGELVTVFSGEVEYI